MYIYIYIYNENFDTSQYTVPAFLFVVANASMFVYRFSVGKFGNGIYFSYLNKHMFICLYI